MAKTSSETIPDNFDPQVGLTAYPNTLERYREIAARTSSPTKTRQLRNLAWVLIAQTKSTPADYKISTIGRRTEASGGPTVQTIRNRNGHDYRDIIRAFCNECTPDKNYSKKSNTEHNDQILSRIPDLATRNRIKLLLNENLSLRNQLNLLKNQLARHAPPIPTSISILAPPSTHAAAASLSKTRLGAIEKFVSSQNLASKRWRLNEYGALVDAFDVEIAPPGFVDALRQFLSELK